MAKNRMTFEKTQREHKKRQKAALKRANREARKLESKMKADEADAGMDTDVDPNADEEGNT